MSLTRHSLFSLLRFVLGGLAALLWSFSPAEAQLPDIPAAIETQIYQGTPEAIAAFIDKRQVEIDDLIAQISVQAKEQQGEEGSSQVIFTSLEDLFQGLSFQLRNIKDELARSEIPPLSPPSLGDPPYSLDSFDDLVDFHHKAEQQLDLYTEMQTIGDARIAALNSEFPEMRARYLSLKDEADHKIQAYETLAHLLTMQHEQALIQLKKPKVQTALTRMQEVVKEDSRQIEKVFNGLLPGKVALAAEQKKSEALQDKSARSLARLNGESLELNKQIVVVGAKLDKVATALAIAVKGDEAADHLVREKELLEMELLSTKIRQKSIIQEKMSLDFARQSASFRQEWLAASTERTTGTNLRVFLDSWRKKREALNSEKEFLLQELALVARQRADVTKRLMALVDADDHSPAQTAIARKSSTTTKSIEAFVINITDNTQSLSRLQEDISLILRLFRNKMDWKERLLSQGREFITDKGETVAKVLFYPLISMGGVAISLTLIAKTMLLCWIGMRLLKAVRRKTVVVLKEKTAMAPGAINSLTTLVYYGSLALGALLVLSLVGFQVSQLGIIFGALGVGIGFGLQTVFNNFFSGIILLSEQSIQVGDFVELATGVDGEVRKISIRATIVRTFDGEDVIVPNSEFVSSRVSTWSFDDNWRRLKIPFGVSYGSDPEEVVRLATEAAREVQITREDSAHPLRVFFEGFGNNSLDFSIRPWCWMNQIHAHTGMISDYYFALFKKFKEAGIEIPFPQTDLHIKSIAPEALRALQHLHNAQNK